MAENISKDQALKTLVKGSSIGFFGMVISQTIVYLLRLFLARALTPSEYGLLFLGLSFINITMSLSSLALFAGIERYVPYYMAKNERERAKGVVWSSIKMVFPFSIFLFVLIFIYADEIGFIFFGEPSLGSVLRIFSFSIPLYAMFKIFETVYLAFKKIKYDLISWHFGRSFVTLFFVVAFSILGFGLLGVTTGYVLGYAFATFSSLILMQKIFPISRSKEGMYKKLLVFSLPVLLYGILADITTRIDTLLLGALKTSNEVGIYQTSIPTAQFLWSIPGTLGLIFVPVMTELYAKRKMDEMKGVYKTIAKWGFYVNFPIFLLFFMYPNAVINTLFGNEYLVAGNSLRILSFGYMIYFIGLLSTLMLNVLEKTKYHILNSGLSLLLAFTLNYILIPAYGIDGAAIATAVALTFYTILATSEVYIFSKNLPLHKNMVHGIFSGILSILSIYTITKILFVSLNIFILIMMFIAFFALYVFLLLVMKGFSSEDIMILKAIEKKTGLKIDFLRKLIKKFI